MEKSTQSGQNRKPMEAYVVMLHLVSQKRAKFTDIRDLLFWDVWKQAEAIRVMAHINHRLLDLSEEWGEEIPRINAFMFEKEGFCTSYVCENIFKTEQGNQPTPRQIAEYADAIYFYDKWDKVLDVFREEAFIAKT